MSFCKRFRYKQVKCPDGSKIIVFHDANDAFPILDKKFHMKLSARARTVLEDDISINGELKNKTSSLLSALDVRDLASMDDFYVLYLVYQSNPCENKDYLKTRIEEITKSRNILRDKCHLVEKFVELTHKYQAKPKKIKRIFKTLEKSISPDEIEFDDTFNLSRKAINKLMKKEI